MPITIRRLISIKEFSNEYGVGVAQAYAAAKKGQIPVFRLGRRLWIVRDALEERLRCARLQKPSSRGATLFDERAQPPTEEEEWTLD